MGKKIKNGGLLALRKVKASEIVKDTNCLTNLIDDLKVAKDRCVFQTANVIYTINILRTKYIDEDIIDRLFLLLKSNMQDLYEKSSWGWKPQTKRLESFAANSFVVLCYADSGGDDGQQLAGFVSFRFQREDEHPVLYCYEIQLYPQFCGQSVGTFLMNVLADLAVAARMHRILLTVFKKNVAARSFFKKNGFIVDQTDPSQFKGNPIVDYVIMSKLV